MKKFLTIPMFAAITCIPFTAQSWWGPYGGPYWGGAYPYAAPYWGGYAPPMYAPPPYPAYGYAPHGNHWKWRHQDYRIPSWEPDDMYNDDFAAPYGKEAFESSDADRKQTFEAAESRRAAFRARAEARKNEMKAKRDAWHKRMEQMGAMDRYSGQAASEIPATTTPESVSKPIDTIPVEQTKTPTAVPTTKP